MKFIRNEKGFTLIELMVVILIIGILVAIAVPVFNSAKASAQKRACQANLRTMDGAMEAWKAENWSDPYPSDIQDLVDDGYIKNYPVCPAAGVYSVPNGGTQSSPSVVCSLAATLGHSYP